MSVFPGQCPPPLVLCGPGAPQRRPGADRGFSAPGQGQEGQWVSYAARQPGHTSPALAAFATKNSPSHRARLLPLQPGCCFSGWSLLATVLCVRSTVTLAAAGPYLTQAGAQGVSCSVAVTMWTHGGFLESPHRAPPTPLQSLCLISSSPSLTLPPPHTHTHTLPLPRTLWSLTLQGPGMSQNVS